VLTPFLLIAFPTAEAVAIVAIPHAMATAVRWYRLRHDVHLPTFKQFGIASALGGLVGAALQPLLASDLLSVVLAVLLLSAGVSQLRGRPLPFPATRIWRILGGALSGAFGGLVGNQGGLRAAALLGFDLDARALVATATASALFVDAARVPIYVVMRGGVLASTVPYWVAGSVGVVVGTLIGVPILGRIPQPIYRKLIAILLIALALVLVASTLH
ncbi:MAG TPA: sulfite exporter TauE/SafE family protein, partial [Polyangiaceae bacterium]|nr:sulfite exporter TauE/SafE family protein [Polyangiaceae bacterium]